MASWSTTVMVLTLRSTLCSVKKNTLQLIFYYDDVEICNPLGSKRSVQKLGMLHVSHY